MVISNFSLGIEEWVEVANLNHFAVDVTDTSSGVQVSTSGTYFIHDGKAVTTTYSGISGGYRCFYSPTSVTSSGIINLVVHAENTNNEVLERSYSLLYGYNCLFNEEVDWGPYKDVITIVKATNEVSCPHTSKESFYFTTKDLPACDLGAFIGSIESLNLGAVIYPQSTFFFYGRTYRVTISGVKDFSGNKLDPYTFTFTINDPRV